MIDRINPNTTNTKNVFAPFQTNNGANYAITKPFYLPSSEPFKTGQNVEIETEEEKSHALGISLATTALIGGFGAWLLISGLPKTGYKNLDKFFGFIDSKIQKLAGNEKRTKIQQYTLSGLKKIRSVTKNAKSLFNTMTLKDIFIEKMLDKVPGIKKASKWISKTFEKISERAVNKSYSKTSGHFDEMLADFNEINKSLLKNGDEKRTINGVTKTIKEWIEDNNGITNKIKTIEKNFNGFRPSARRERLSKVKSDLSIVADKIWNDTFIKYKKIKNIFNDKKLVQTFISEKYAEPVKTGLNKEVSTIRRSITNDINDNCQITKRILKDVGEIIEPSDIASRKIAEKIKTTMLEYKRLAGSTENIERDKLNKIIIQNLNDLSNSVNNSGAYKQENKEVITNLTKSMQDIIQNSKKGELQEILTIYKDLLPKKDYLEIKKSTYKTIKSLDKSIDYETDKLFDKLRDIKIGSAPTDVVGVLTSLGVVAFGLSKADNKEERTSVALKYGIPAVGATLISLLCTVSMISGGSAIIIGLLSGLAMNKIGAVADDKIKELKDKPLNLNTIESQMDYFKLK